MDKNTLSNYGWIVICILVISVMLALATPFGEFVAGGFRSTYEGLTSTMNAALEKGLGIDLNGDGEVGGNTGSGETGGETPDEPSQNECEHLNKEYVSIDNDNHMVICNDCNQTIVDSKAHNFVNDVCDGCGHIVSIVYDMIEKPMMSINKNQPATFSSSAPFNTFVETKVDTNTLDTDNYSANEVIVSGQSTTTVALNTTYIATLEDGTHTMEIVSTNGSASCEFVKETVNYSLTAGTYAVADIEWTKSTIQGDTYEITYYHPAGYDEYLIIGGTIIFFNSDVSTMTQGTHQNANGNLEYTFAGTGSFIRYAAGNGIGWPGRTQEMKYEIFQSVLYEDNSTHRTYTTKNDRDMLIYKVEATNGPVMGGYYATNRYEQHINLNFDGYSDGEEAYATWYFNKYGIYPNLAQ